MGSRSAEWMRKTVAMVAAMLLAGLLAFSLPAAAWRQPEPEQVGGGWNLRYPGTHVNLTVSSLVAIKNTLGNDHWISKALGKHLNDIIRGQLWADDYPYEWAAKHPEHVPTWGELRDAATAAGIHWHEWISSILEGIALAEGIPSLLALKMLGEIVENQPAQIPSWVPKIGGKYLAIRHPDYSLYHLYEPDSWLQKVCRNWGNAVSRAEFWYQEALKAYSEHGEESFPDPHSDDRRLVTAYDYLGRALHYVQDMTCPAHSKDFNRHIVRLWGYEAWSWESSAPWLKRVWSEGATGRDFAEKAHSMITISMKTWEDLGGGIFAGLRDEDIFLKESTPMFLETAIWVGGGMLVKFMEQAAIRKEDQYPDNPSQASLVSPGSYSDRGGEEGDLADCLAFRASQGQSITLALTAPRGTDFDLKVYRPSDTSYRNPWKSDNVNTSNDNISVTSAPETGKYVACVTFFLGSGAWNLTIGVGQGPSAPILPQPSPLSPPPPPPEPTTAFVLVMDVSGSMAWEWQGEVKLESAKRVASQTINLIEEEARASGAAHSLAIVSFSDQANLLLSLTHNYQQAKGVVLSLGTVASTNLGAGLQVALAELSKAPLNSQRYVILLTDGHITSGMSEGEVLAGPVSQARQGRICIHTVGFGDPSYLKEDFLRRISQESGCGQYLYAKNPFELTNAYIKLRHLSLGGLIAEFISQGARIYQGETLTLGAVSIPSPKQNQGKAIEELHFTLSWSGSKLRPKLFDPSDVEVTLGYPGADIKFFDRFAHVIVLKPKPGLWRVEISGEQVPPEGSDFYAVLSTRPGEPGQLARAIPLINPVICIEYPWGKQCRYLIQGSIPTWMIVILTMATLAVVVYLKLSGQMP